MVKLCPEPQGQWVLGCHRASQPEHAKYSLAGEAKAGTLEHLEPRMK